MVVAGTLEGTGSGGGRKEEDGSAILLSAASHAEREPSGSGRFWHQRELTGEARPSPAVRQGLVPSDPQPPNPGHGRVKPTGPRQHR
ncbi:hypothetical protein ACZ90_29545 [Streptomyces albus subsp. albus]|nr:hypothetical protein ACZ90_29545 [Streptomyces albus subsp. albus]